MQLSLLSTHELHQLVMHNLDQLLVWRHAFDNTHAKRLLFNSLNKLPHGWQAYLQYINWLSQVASALTRLPRPGVCRTCLQEGRRAAALTERYGV